MKIAVIGAGLGGLSAAWLLARQHEVILFERLAEPGFTAHSIVWPGDDGTDADPQRIDVPLRVFYPGYYPTLTRLYDTLGVRSEAVSYASSFDDGAALYFRYRNLRLGSHSYSLMAPQDLLLGASARRIAASLLRFHREAPAALARGELAGSSIGQYLSLQRYHADFVQGFVLPAVCTVCTCTYAQAREFPAAVIVDYVARGLARDSVRRACGGADAVLQRLLAGIPTLHHRTPVEAVWRDADTAWLRPAGGTPQRFDHIVLAAQANQSRHLLPAASAEETAMLEGFHYTPVEVVTHRDASFMPPRRRDWSPVNLRVVSAQDAPQSTIWVNAVMPARRGRADVFQTVHPHRPPAPQHLIARARFERPVVNLRSQQALRELQTLHDEAGRRLWFCGAYAQAGIPLLESAVHSAFEVASRLGAPTSAAPLTASPPRTSRVAG